MKQIPAVIIVGSIFLAKSIERIGDHAKNIAELIIYVVKGADIRHTSMEQIESVLK